MSVVSGNMRYCGAQMCPLAKVDSVVMIDKDGEHTDLVRYSILP